MAVVPPDTDRLNIHSETHTSTNPQVTEPVHDPENHIPLQQIQVPNQPIYELP